MIDLLRGFGVWVQAAEREWRDEQMVHSLLSKFLRYNPLDGDDEDENDDSNNSMSLIRTRTPNSELVIKSSSSNQIRVLGGIPTAKDAKDEELRIQFSKPVASR